MTVLVTLEQVTKRYRRGGEVVTAVDDVSLQLAPATTTALVGPSGSGKTTLLNLIAGGEVPDSGAIVGRVNCDDWTELAVVPQTLGLLPELTMGENVDLPRRLGASSARDAIEVMEELGIGALINRPPHETSLGEQQRAAVARSLLTRPDLLVADEPTSHQDAANTARVTAAFAALAADGSGVLIATHDPRVLERCDRVLYIRDGAISIGE